MTPLISILRGTETKIGPRTRIVRGYAYPTETLRQEGGHVAMLTATDDTYVVIVGDNCRAVVLFIVIICEFLVTLTNENYNLMLTWNRESCR